MPPLSVVLVRDLLCRVARVVVIVVACALALYAAMWLGAYDAAYFGGSP